MRILCTVSVSGCIWRQVRSVVICTLRVFHVYCFLMMISIMHTRIWLTHRGGGLHFSFACFNQCNNFDQNGQLCP